MTCEQPTVDPRLLVTAIRRLLNFPFPQICRHSVACDLLSILEISGLTVSQELAGAVVRAEDDAALAFLPELESQTFLDEWSNGARGKKLPLVGS